MNMHAVAVIGLALSFCGAACGGPAPGPDPRQAYAPSPTFISGNLEPMVVDWQPEQRGDLEIAMRDGLVVVGYDAQGFRLLKDCHVNGTYGFAGMTRREKVVRLETSDDIKANLPLGGLGLAARLGGELAKGATLDIAMVMIGKVRTTWRSVGREDLAGQCAGATHVVRGGTVGAFALDKGDRSHARAVADIFGAGLNAGTASASLVRTVDGDLQDCATAGPEAKAAPKQCGALIKVELLAIVAQKDGKTSAAADAHDAGLGDTCPPGFTKVDEKCTTAKTAPPQAVECTYGKAQECVDLCKSGNAMSCTRLAVMFLKGEGVPANPQQGAQAAIAACNGGEATGCNLVGNLLERGVGLPKDPAKAAQIYAKGCDDGNAEACSGLGNMTLGGFGIPRNVQLAAKALQRGCDGGAHAACSDLGLMALGGQGFAKELPFAAGLFKRACDGDNAIGCSNFAYMLEFGQGVAKNQPVAVQSYAKACKLDDASCTWLGAMFQMGKGVPRDEARAVALFRAACTRGDTVACAILRGYVDPKVTFDVERAKGELNVWRGTCENGIPRDCTVIGVIGVADNEREDGKRFLAKGCQLGDDWGCTMAKLTK